MGRPMASTEPKAMIKMTIAKPTPMASDDGASNSAKYWPPSSTSSPSTSGAASRSSSAYPSASVACTSPGRFTVA